MLTVVRNKLREELGNDRLTSHWHSTFPLVSPKENGSESRRGGVKSSKGQRGERERESKGGGSQEGRGGVAKAVQLSPIFCLMSWLNLPCPSYAIVFAGAPTDAQHREVFLLSYFTQRGMRKAERVG